jgi:hypothetical protein
MVVAAGTVQPGSENIPDAFLLDYILGCLPPQEARKATKISPLNSPSRGIVISS